MKPFYRQLPLRNLRCRSSFCFEVGSDIFYRGRMVTGCGSVRIYSKPDFSCYTPAVRYVNYDTLVWTRCW